MAGTIDFRGVQADEPVAAHEPVDGTVQERIAGHLVRGTPEALTALQSAIGARPDEGRGRREAA